jgi:hypothetical protein
MMASRVLLIVLCVAAAERAAGEPQAQPDAVEQFVTALEQVAANATREQIRDLTHPDAEIAGIEDFYYALTPAPARIVIKERDRATLDNGNQRLLLEVFLERGIEARVSTWQVELREATAPDGHSASVLRLFRIERLTVVSGLYRLELDTSRQFDIRNLTLTGPDLTIRMTAGSAFLAEAADGPTAIVLLGRGRMRLAPPHQAEQTQLRIFSGSETLDAEFDAAFIRIRPAEFRTRFRAESLVAREVSSSDARRATGVFDDFVGRTLQIDLSDLSRDRWSLVPSPGDMVAEVRTRRHGSLTYARAWGDAEDVSLFDRKGRRNISVYASAEKLAARGRFYSEDDLVDYDVLACDVDAAFTPSRSWIAGNARVKVRVRAPALTTMTLRLAETLTVRGVYSPNFGRLLHLRVVGQNSLIVNLPVAAPHGSELWLNVIYSGRVAPQELDREALALRQDPEGVQIPLEPRYIYSNRSYWYPQSTVSDYATSRLRITVPPEFDVVASGMQTAPPAPAAGPVAPGERPHRVFVFDSDRPVRYLALVISRFSVVTTAELAVPSLGSHATADGGQAELDHESGPVDQVSSVKALSLSVQANPRQTGRARGLGEKSAEIFQFYASLLGEVPYPSFTLAVTESDLPGGHSPPYFAVLHQALPTAANLWRNDPVAFENYPTFFLAHELAHQWWGHAIGWKNYHEQWLSEGFAQYFATLFAERERGSGVLAGLMRQMRRWAIEQSPQGPVHLGYRLGHIKGDSRVFRALVYNKAAMVLHMLRRLVGDEQFLVGLRGFYAEWRFRKAGTDDFRRTMEAATGEDLTSFFEAWIHGSAIPRLRFTHTVNDDGLLLRFEHQATVMPVPVTVTLTYTGGETEQVVVRVTEPVVEQSVTLKGALRRVEVNDDFASLAEFER